MKTKPDWFMTQLAGSELELTDEQKGVLIENAEHMLRGCVTILPEQWAALSPESKMAFIVAGNKIREEQARAISEAVAQMLESDPVTDDKA